MQAGHKRRAVSKPPKKRRLKNRLHFKNRVLGVDAQGRGVTARTVAKHAKPLEERRRQRRLEQEAADEAEDPTYVSVEANVNVAEWSSLSSGD